jgi:transcriptional regulator with AAA-type ATPase domain
VSDRACFDTGYVIGRGNAGDVLDPGVATSFWRSAHELAVARDWSRAVDAVLAADQADPDNTLRSWLVGQGPAGVLAAGTHGDDGGDTRLAPLLSRLARSAREIVARRTVFLVPEEEASLGRLAKRAGMGSGEFVERLSEHLYQLLEHGQADSFTFVRVGSPSAGTAVLDRMIGYLHSRLTAGILDQAKIRREGPVLLVGPTGTGKSYGARLLANMLGKTNFVTINLSAVVETTLESRIHGYAPGAFTGASRIGSPGWFEQASNGVLFLDEFQSVPVAYQTQLLDLLHAVSDRVTVARIGDDGGRMTWRVKVILAVNEDIGELLRSGRLREDLFYRMRHLVHFPSLRERLADQATRHLTLGILLKTYRWRLAPVIAQVTAPRDDGVEPSPDELTRGRLRTMFPELEAAAADRLLEHPWPGNLRELERVASDLFCDCDSAGEPLIAAAQVDSAIRPFAVSGSPASQPAAGPSHAASGLLADVEHALRAGGFVIEHALGQLRKSHPMYRLRSRRSLRTFLRENREQLSDDVHANPRLRRFIQEKKSSQGPGSGAEVA